VTRNDQIVASAYLCNGTPHIRVIVHRKNAREILVNR